LKKTVALSVLPLVLLFGGVAFSQSPNSVPGKLDSIESKIDALTTQVTSLTAKVDSLAANNKGPRMFYLTKNEYTGSQAALTTCAAGYHMASLWEIFDPTNLRYNTDLGFNWTDRSLISDMGFGPPSGLPGWIRTGQPSLSSFFNNCNAWTTDSGNGTVILLNSDWGGKSGVPVTVAPWVSLVAGCSIPVRVWCVQD
jgi:hypothetical protein